jgi:broad specificity phosphatase PhoE
VILYLIRHGETASNRDGLGQGRADHPLTEAGLLQAGALAQRFDQHPVDLVVSSPLLRARGVAEVIAARSGCLVELSEQLHEMDIGETEGLSPADMRQRFPEFMTAWAAVEMETVTMPDGESLLDVRDRIAPILEELIRRPLERVALVSHNFVLKVALCHLLGLRPNAFRGFTVDLTSLSTVNVNAAASPLRVSLLGLNDTCHLYGLNLQALRRSL